MSLAAPTSNEAKLPPLPGGWQAISFAALADGALAIVGTDVDLRSEWRQHASGGVLGDPYAVASTANAQIWTFEGEGLIAGPAFPLGSPHPIVDRFADGRWIVASCRGDGANARVLSAGGEELNRIRLGDGIEHLKIDDAGHVWVGWFDEGVFGNEGWVVPGLKWSPSAYGLVGFTDEGEVVAGEAELPGGISDCYALNVIGECAFACTYTEFPIISVSAGRSSRSWKTDLRGPRALAISWPYVLAAGGYAEDGNRIAVLRMSERGGEQLAEWRLPVVAGHPSGADLFDGRGDTLHIVHDGVWRRWRVEDFLGDV